VPDWHKPQTCSVCGRCVTNVGYCFLCWWQTFCSLSFCASVCYHGNSHIAAYEAFSFSSRRSVLFFSESERVACISWSINWSWFCLSLPGRPAALMKLFNEAERGNLSPDPDDHACRWHRKRRWHLGTNYTDFTPARDWIKPVLSDGWLLRDITPKPSHLLPPGGRKWLTAKWRGSRWKKRPNCFILCCSGLNHGNQKQKQTLIAQTHLFL